jgi:hypothetical protein
VDEAPVPDANPREAFEVVWPEKTLLKQQPSQPQKSVTAGAHAAHVIAVSVELANPAAAAIAVMVVTVVAGGDGGADNRGADEARSNAPAERLGLRLAGGDAIVPVTARVARARAANLVLIDMEVSILWLGGHCGPHASWTERVRKRFEKPPGNMVSSFIS